MSTDNTATVQFVSPCEGGSTCVEVATLSNLVLVRDSKLTDSPILAFSRAEWCEFITAARRGEFDFA